jgi:hypothetical protein
MIGSAELLTEYGEWIRHLVPLCAPDHGCAAPGKTPHLRGWQKLPDERRREGCSAEGVADELAAHLRRGGNVGLVVPRGAVVLDADDTRARAFLATACPDDAPVQETSRGCHVVLQLPNDLELTNTTRVELLGHRIDLRGHGSQIVVWPSVHASGHSCRWQRPLPAHPRDLPVLPAALMEALRKHERGRGGRGVEAWHALVANGVEIGERHSTLCSLAGKIFRSSLDPIIGYELLHAWNTARCRPPLPHEEAEQIICDIAARESARRAQR